MTERPRSARDLWPAATTMEGEGLVIRRPFPRARHEHVDPFLLLDHVGPIDVAPGDARGMPKHPHRGYELGTLVVEGEMEQRGAAGVTRLDALDFSWITAGAGILHAELPTDAFRHRGGRLQVVQVWVNLRARDKAMAPRSAILRAGETTVVKRGGATVRVLVGSLAGASSPIAPATPVTLSLVDLDARGSATLPAPEAHAACVYVLEGSTTIGGRETRAGELVLLAPDGDAIAIESALGARVLFLSGEPLRERVYWHGPFVMSTPDQVSEAITDFYTGRLEKRRKDRSLDA